MSPSLDPTTSARLALACLDLTTLNDTDTEADVARLCARANGPHGHVAAVCVWPRLAAFARRELPPEIRVAAVANFPDGSGDVERALRDTAAIVAAGAQEVDLVLPYRSLQAGDEATVKGVGLFTAVATLAVGVYTLTQFDYGQSGKLQFFTTNDWIKPIKATYTIGLDGISLPLYFLSMVITVLVMIYSWNHVPSPGNPKAFFILMLVLQTGMAGTFVAQDLILFFVFFEVVLLPMYFMIGVWGGDNRQYASLKFFLYTMFGSAFMLVAFLALYFKTGGTTFSMTQLADLVQQKYAEGGLTSTTMNLIFAGMALGFAVKVPMFPFHTWLPDAHTQAPTQGSVILAAILLKLGTYGFVRIAIPILPQAAKNFAPFIGLLSVIGIIAVATLAGAGWWLATGDALAPGRRLGDLGWSGALLLAPVVWLAIPYRAVQVHAGLRRDLTTWGMPWQSVGSRF